MCDCSINNNDRWIDDIFGTFLTSYHKRSIFKQARFIEFKNLILTGEAFPLKCLDYSLIVMIELCLVFRLWTMRWYFATVDSRCRGLEVAAYKNCSFMKLEFRTHRRSHRGSETHKTFYFISHILWKIRKKQVMESL